MDWGHSNLRLTRSFGAVMLAGPFGSPGVAHAGGGVEVHRSVSGMRAMERPSSFKTQALDAKDEISKLAISSWDCDVKTRSPLREGTLALKHGCSCVSTQLGQEAKQG